MRTVASYLGHANVAMTLNTYADVDPDAKRAAVSRVEDAFDVDMSSIIGKTVEEEPTPPSAQLGLLFTADQLEVMLVEARKREREAVWRQLVRCPAVHHAEHENPVGG